MNTHQIDARALNAGETFLRMGVRRRVVRMRLVCYAPFAGVKPGLVNTTEILHGLENHPGSLEYTMFPFGQTVVAPIFP
jgi:hypothetical protein